MTLSFMPEGPCKSSVQHFSVTSHTDFTMEVSNQRLFESVCLNDLEELSKLFAQNSRNALISYLSMRQRWESDRKSSHDDASCKYDFRAPLALSPRLLGVPSIGFAVERFRPSFCSIAFVLLFQIVLNGDT